MEALVILLVPLVAFGVWAAAYFQPRTTDLAAEQVQLEQHIAWLEDRLAYGRQKNWDEQMIASLTAQLAEARERRAA